MINYGFEDWTGSEDTTPGYIYSGSNSDYWSDHTGSNQVVATGNANCAGAAHGGTYYIHRSFWTGGADACLGGTATSINDHGNIGYNSTYPIDSGDNTQLSTAITENTLTVRFYFRATGNWKTHTEVTGMCKFFRLYGTGGTGDSSSAFVHVIRGNNTNTQFALLDPSSGYQYYNSGVDLQDGNWHSAAIRVVRNNDTNSTGNITISVWWDNWDMTGDPTASRTITSSAFGSAFQLFALAQNWSATYPSSAMGIDFDDFEVWNGDTDQDSTAPTVTAFTIPSTSTNLQVSISSFTCTDAVGVTGYLVNESADAPSATGAGWTATAPASYTFSSTGEKTLYGWCKDAANNVSTSGTDTVTVSQAISKAPFIIP